MIKVIHTLCGCAIPDVEVIIESQSNEVLLLGSTKPHKFPQPPIFVITNLREECPKCNYRLYKKDIALMIGGDQSETD